MIGPLGCLPSASFAREHKDGASESTDARLGDPFGTDEAAGFDVAHPCAGESVDELCFDGRWNWAGLILEAVTGPDFHYLDKVGIGCTGGA